MLLSDMIQRFKPKEIPSNTFTTVLPIEQKIRVILDTLNRVEQEIEMRINTIYQGQEKIRELLLRRDMTNVAISYEIHTWLGMSLDEIYQTHHHHYHIASNLRAKYCTSEDIQKRFQAIIRSPGVENIQAHLNIYMPNFDELRNLIMELRMVYRYSYAQIETVLLEEYRISFSNSYLKTFVHNNSKYFSELIEFDEVESINIFSEGATNRNLLSAQALIPPDINPEGAELFYRQVSFIEHLRVDHNLDWENILLKFNSEFGTTYIRGSQIKQRVISHIKNGYFNRLTLELEEQIVKAHRFAKLQANGLAERKFTEDKIKEAFYRYGFPPEGVSNKDHYHMVLQAMGLVDENAPQTYYLLQKYVEEYARGLGLAVEGKYRKGLFTRSYLDKLISTYGLSTQKGQIKAHYERIIREEKLPVDRYLTIKEAMELRYTEA